MKSVTAAQERLDMRSGCHAAKILPVGVRGTKNVWCLSSLITNANATVELLLVRMIECMRPFIFVSTTTRLLFLHKSKYLAQRN